VAAGAAMAQAVGAGSHIIFPDDMYVDFRNLAKDFLPGWGIESCEVNLQDAAAVERAFKPNTKLLWIETPSNPLMKVVDVAALAKMAHQRGARVVVDNTFATPVFQRVLDLGADFALHSTTKYFGGHSDVQGGALIAKRKDEVLQKLAYVRQVIGGVASPFNSWLVLRGIRSLPCRMQKHSANAMGVAQALEKSKAISAVHYPGLTSHSGHQIAKRQMTGFGGMLSIQLKGGREAALRTCSRVKLFTVATSLGGVESLIEHRASSEGKSSKAPPDLLRISTGLEDAGDLIADLEQAISD
jgi:cystathionine gamma-synthase